jgi:hypothetical protein
LIVEIVDERHPSPIYFDIVPLISVMKSESASIPAMILSGISGGHGSRTIVSGWMTITISS